MADKLKMKKVLYDLSSPEEQAKYASLELAQLNESLAGLREAVSDGAKTSEITSLTKTLTESIRRMNASILNQSKEAADTFVEAQKSLLKGITDLQTALVAQSAATNANAGPLYKTMINHLAGMEKSFSTWKYPQYAAVSVRNKNFANINPSVDGFDIGSFDDIVLSYTGSNITGITYSLNGATTVNLALSYDLSGNLTEIKRV